MKYADLHIHTNFSDSTLTPREVVEQAAAQGISGIAITDHDTVAAIQITMDEAKEFDIEVIPGIEFSTELNGKDIHILGYFFDTEHQELKDRIYLFQNARMERMKQMIEKLQEVGVDNITLDEVRELAESDSVGRPHLATLLIKKGWVTDTRHAFNKYLGENCSAYIPKFKQTPAEAIKLLRDAGGVSVFAHPMSTHMDEVIPDLVKAGLDGLEVYYPNCAENTIQFYEGIARKHNLLMTGGSDSHGKVKESTYIGKKRIDYELVEGLRDLSLSRRR